MSVDKIGRLAREHSPAADDEPHRGQEACRGDMQRAAMNASEGLEAAICPVAPWGKTSLKGVAAAALTISDASRTDSYGRAAGPFAGLQTS